MTTATLPTDRRSGGLERLAWLGLAAGLCAVWAAASGARPCVIGYAALSPQDFTAWVTAICSAIGAATAAANGVAIVIHRWGRKPRKPRKRKGDDAQAEKPAG